MVHLAAVLLVLALAYPWLRGHWFVPTLLSIPVGALALLFLWAGVGVLFVWTMFGLAVLWTPKLVQVVFNEPQPSRPVEAVGATVRMIR